MPVRSAGPHPRVHPHAGTTPLTGLPLPPPLPLLEVCMMRLGLYSWGGCPVPPMLPTRLRGFSKGGVRDHS